MKTTSVLSDPNRYFNFDENTTNIYLGVEESIMLEDLEKLSPDIKKKTGVILLNSVTEDLDNLARIVERVYRSSLLLSTAYLQNHAELQNAKVQIREIFSHHAIYIHPMDKLVNHGQSTSTI